MDLEIAVNAGVLEYLCGGVRGQGIENMSPQDVDDPYMKLGTHPDVVQRLWDELTVDLPKSCQWVVCRTPALVRKQSGVIFGIAGGSHFYALRLAPGAYAEAIERGAVPLYRWGEEHSVDLARFGEGWIVGGWRAEEPRWCLSAYEYAVAGLQG
jgi:hypothetical protein